MGNQPKHNWTILKEKWLSFEGTMREFAEREGIPYYTIARKATQEKWHAARELTQITAEAITADLAKKIEDGKINLTEFRRDQAWRNYVTLVAMRDNPKLRASDRARVAEKLAEWDGVPKLEEDHTGDRSRPLTDDELVQLKLTVEALLELRGAGGGGLSTPSPPAPSQ